MMDGEGRAVSDGLVLDDNLRRLFAPRSIAIIGASDRPGSFGSRTQENLARFSGDLHLEGMDIGGKCLVQNLTGRQFQG